MDLLNLEDKIRSAMYLYRKVKRTIDEHEIY